MIDKELDKEIKKHLLLADIEKLIASGLNIDEISLQSKNLCKIYFPNADKYLVNAIQTFSRISVERFYQKLDIDFFIKKYKTTTKRNSTKWKMQFMIF